MVFMDMLCTVLFLETHKYSVPGSRSVSISFFVLSKNDVEMRSHWNESDWGLLQLRPEYLHLVAVVETVMILPTSSTIGSSYHFRNWIASHPSLHPSPRLQSRNEPISTTYRRLFILNQKVVFLLEAGIRDCNNGVFRVPDFVSELCYNCLSICSWIKWRDPDFL